MVQLIKIGLLLFSSVPLIIEVWNKSETMKDELLGIAQVQLSNVLLTEKKVVNGYNTGVFRIPSKL